MYQPQESNMKVIYAVSFGGLIFLYSEFVIKQLPPFFSKGRYTYFHVVSHNICYISYKNVESKVLKYLDIPKFCWHFWKKEPNCMENENHQKSTAMEYEVAWRIRAGIQHTATAV